MCFHKLKIISNALNHIWCRFSRATFSIKFSLSWRTAHLWAGAGGGRFCSPCIARERVTIAMSARQQSKHSTSTFWAILSIFLKRSSQAKVMPKIKIVTFRLIGYRVWTNCRCEPELCLSPSEAMKKVAYKYRPYRLNKGQGRIKGHQMILSGAQELCSNWVGGGGGAVGHIIICDVGIGTSNAHICTGWGILSQDQETVF